jgi:SAM-dependent methyltransferase
MHKTAYEHGRLFFELYGASFRRVIDLGSQDVNGSLRDHCPCDAFYIGLDMSLTNGVDVVVSQGGPLPIASASIDAVVTSSAFEHDVCFWETFVELARILRPGGLLYINVPSNHAFHRYPLDCWRFYPDAGVALAQWSTRQGQPLELLESFIAEPDEASWADFVAVFRRAGGPPLQRRGRIAEHTQASNIHDLGMPVGAALLAETQLMPEMRAADIARAALKERDAEVAALAAEVRLQGKALQATRQDVIALQARLVQAEAERRAAEAAQAEATAALRAVWASTSWLATAWLRHLSQALQPHRGQPDRRLPRDLSPTCPAPRLPLDG